MQIGQASLNDVLGIPLFMLALLLFFLFLTSWLAPSPANRRFILIVTALVVMSGVLAEAGVVWMGWTPPWQEKGIVTPAASLLDLIVLPALAGLGLGIWLVLSGMGVLSANTRFKFSVPRALLLGLSCLLYEVGMIVLRWPAPWNLPIPSQ